MVKIDGRTKIVGIIGKPIEHSLSPIMYNAAFQELGLNWCYLPFSVEPEGLESAIESIKALQMPGVNITMPYKEAVMRFLDESTLCTKIVGAVNTIHNVEGKLIGYNTDGRGFIKAIETEASFSPKEKTIFIIGAGGAARSVVLSLALEGAKKIYIYNRTKQRAELLAQMAMQKVNLCQAEAYDFNQDVSLFLKKSNMIVNATPWGQERTEVEIPLPMESITKSHFICDLVYAPEVAPLMERANEVGAITISGLSILLFQGAFAFEIWTGREAPIEIMRKSLLKKAREEKINSERIEAI